MITGGREHGARPPSSAWVWRGPALAILVAVGSFAAASGYAFDRLRSMDRDLYDLEVDALPSLGALAEARARVVELAAALEAHDLAQTPEALAGTHERVRLSLRGAHRQLERIAASPDDGERPLHQHVEALFAELERDAQRALEDPSADDVVRALRVEIAAEAAAIDQALVTLVAFNRARALEHLRDIRRARDAHASLLLGLYAASSVVAIAAAAIVMQVGRRYVTLRDEHACSLEERAGELELFAGRVAHDVKSPLAVVAMALERARRTEAGADRQVIERAAAAVRRVASLVDGLLAFALAGARPEPGASCDAREVIGGIASEIGPEADAASIAIVVEPFEPVRVACAPGILSSLVGNLVRNATKFMGDSVERRVTVRVRPIGDRVRIEVRDTGPGLPPDAAATVFEPFVRGASKQPGIGLGLATVKRAAEAHGGAVGVRSVPGEGACFWFELPRAV